MHGFSARDRLVEFDITLNAATHRLWDKRLLSFLDVILISWMIVDVEMTAYFDGAL